MLGGRPSAFASVKHALGRAEHRHQTQPPPVVSSALHEAWSWCSS